MARSSFQQTAFIGGEVSPLAQGRSDQPWYRQALTLSLNGVTIEEGAWVRRSGTEFIVPTRDRTYAKLLPFDGSATCAFAMVFTANNLQFVTQSSLVFDNTVSTVTTGGGVTYTPAQSTWAVGDQMMVVFPDATSPLYPYPQADEAFLRNKLLTIGTKVSTTEIVLNDDQGNNPGQGTGALVGAQLMRVLNIGTP